MNTALEHCTITAHWQKASIVDTTSGRYKVGLLPHGMHTCTDYISGVELTRTHTAQQHGLGRVLRAGVVLLSWCAGVGAVGACTPHAPWTCRNCPLGAGMGAGEVGIGWRGKGGVSIGGYTGGSRVR